MNTLSINRPQPKLTSLGAGTRRPSRRGLLAAAVAPLILLTALAPAHASAAAGAETDKPAVRIVPAAEQQAVRKLNHKQIATIARPERMPEPRGSSGKAPRNGADGPALRFGGAKPTRAAATSQASTARSLSASAASPAATTNAVTAAAATAVNGVLWPGGATANPNAQVGKLYYDIDPSPTVTTWKHCTGTAINSENKSLVLTAGHCVYDITNRRWHTNMWFYPGYENGAKLGAWPVRTMSTTGNYFASGALADDMAIVLVQKDSAGVALVNRVGGHGIAFNQPVKVMRTSFGYPVTDSRWPGFTASGHDLYYCQSADTYYSTGQFAGQMVLPCRMTGGASGGPWLSSVQSNWMGVATSVNSNKGGIGSAWSGYMFGPYMGSQEAAVFSGYRAA